MSGQARMISRGARIALALVALVAGLCLLCACGRSQSSSDERAASSDGDSNGAVTQHHEEPEHSDDYHHTPHEQEHHQGGSSDAAVSKSDKTMQVTLNGQSFTIELFENSTVDALVKMLPLQVEMSELDGNEKYVYLDSSLPTNPVALGTVEAGDVMLFQGNCLVIFYETHQTSYTYTRIGKISDTSALASAAGAGAVSARFESK